jgi:hypothetical protein
MWDSGVRAAVISRALGELRSEWSGVPAFALVAGIAPPPGSSGAGVGERDFSAMP